jgi:uncharacterized protein (TIGR02145 family)
MKKYFVVILVTIISSSDSWSQKTVKIGNQTWMTENLNIKTFQNGDEILFAADNDKWQKAAVNRLPAWCYHTMGSDTTILYNWHAITDTRGLVPQGFHIPTQKEWIELRNFVSGSWKDGDYINNNQGAYKKLNESLKSISGWCQGNSSTCNGKNLSKFNAFPNATRIWTGEIRNQGDGYWWSSTELEEGYENMAFSFVLEASNSMTSSGNAINSQQKSSGLAVRCIKNIFTSSSNSSLTSSSQSSTSGLASQQNISSSKPVTQSNSVNTILGTFYVKNLGTGDWNYALVQAQKIGYRLPTGEEFSAIMKKTPLSKLADLGFDYSDGRYFWTSKDEDNSWAPAVRKTNALVVWWGSGQTDRDGYKTPEYKLMEKTFGTLGILAIKKIK